jgi:uncharacterized Zn finger protein
MARYSDWYGDEQFPAYVPVARRRANARASIAQLKKQGLAVEPVAIDGRLIASTFWGKAWCSHLESLSDFENRLGRGRSYVRSGAVVHLALDSGRIVAKVQGSDLYEVEIRVEKLTAQRWAKIVAQCTGSIDSLVELLRGKLSESVMRAVTNVETGLFPGASAIKLACSCPDAAELCKHLAAVLYGVGARLDARPELLFTLRGVDASELVQTGAAASLSQANDKGASARHTLSMAALSDVFGIELESAPPARPSPPRAPTAPSKQKRGQGASSERKQPSRAAAPKPSPAPVAAKRGRAAKRSPQRDLAEPPPKRRRSRKA